jgi:putative molybdopterin biosynthesis protein
LLVFVFILSVFKEGEIMQNKPLTPQEVADILKISKCTVYEIIKRKELNAYRVGNKVRVDYEDVEEYKNRTKIIKSKGSQSNIPAQSEAYISPTNSGSYRSSEEKGFIICGQDSLLDTLCRYLGRHPNGIRAIRSYESSYSALYSLYRGDVQVAAAHIWDGKTGQYNTPYVERMLPGVPTVIIHLACRIQGFYVLKGNPKNIKGWEDLKRNDVVLINREAGSGSRILLDEQLKIMGLQGSAINGYANETYSPMALASAIVRGHADMGIGLEMAFLKSREIDFLPIQKEYYDLIVKKENINQPIFKAILDIIRSEDFRMEMHGIGGYDLSECGNIVAET